MPRFDVLLRALTATAFVAGTFSASAQSTQPEAAFQTVDFAANRMNIRHGTIIGKSKCSLFGGARDIKWEIGAVNERSREFRDIFLDAANTSGIPTATSSGSVFTSTEWKNSIYAVGSTISSFDFQGCSDTDSRLSKGTTAILVDWEVYSKLEDRVVYREQMRGTYTAKDSTHDNLIHFMVYAYRDAAQKLTRSAGFRQAIARAPGGGAQAAAPVAGDRWLLPALRPFQTPLQQNIDHITNAAVTIDLGNGHGSGFFLTADGWIMTNAHVTRGSGVVKVVMADGRSVFAQVVRVHDARDVALIKADGAGYPALPLRTAPVRLTEEVYAIGTPVDKKLRASITRGIVSQLRTNEYNLVDIQADAAIHGGSSGGPLIDGHGNVVGIAYSGVGASSMGGRNKLNTGLNFFIPIQDALDKLNLQLGGS